MCAGSGLLTAPLAGHWPAKQLLDMAGHIHCIIQVKVSISIQHVITPEDQQQRKAENLNKGVPKEFFLVEYVTYYQTGEY